MPYDPPYPPRAARYNVMLVATTERFGKQDTTEHRVRNLSEEGACVHSGGLFRIAETMIVTVGNLMAIGAEVRWVKDDLAGIKFTRPIQIADALGKAARPPKLPKSSLTFNGADAISKLST
ncbi:MAG TPA: PilZ domain-containing protein [Sphingomicrobium sp.]